MSATLNDLKELRRILALGSTPYVETILKNEITKLEAQFPSENPTPAPAPKPTGPKRVYQPIDSYAFSDDKDNASIIITHIEGLEEAEIQFNPEPHGFEIIVLREAQGKPNLKLTVSPLYKKIVPEQCKYKVRKQNLTIVIHKKKSQTWMKLKKTSLDSKKPKAPSADPKSKAAEDPNGALMDMMKKMYDEGDDEMKRTISKAMWEAQHKKQDEDAK